MKFLIILTILISTQLFAANKAYDIAKSVDQASSGFYSEAGTMEMILKSGSKEIKREMESSTLETSGEETRTLLVFKLPKDVRGTKLLTHSFNSKDDAQWIYLPALKRVKRISSSSKSSSFMGSEFTFEDLRSASLDKYTYKFISETKVKSDIHWVYERFPTQKSGYTKHLVTTSKKYMGPIRVDYYDRSAQLLKTATFKKFKSFTSKDKVFWRAGSIHMKNLQTNKESILIWKNRVLGTKFKNKIFKKSSLK